MTGPMDVGNRDACDDALFARVSTRLGVARQMRGLTIKDVVGRAGYHASMLSRIENGMAVPTIPALVRLTTALDVSMAWVLDENEGTMPTIHRVGIALAPSRLKRRTSRCTEGPIVPRRLTIAIRALVVKGGAGPVPFTHCDGEATFAVTRGILKVHHGSESVSACVGNSFHICATGAYGFDNGSDGELAVTVFSRSSPSETSRLRAA